MCYGAHSPEKARRGAADCHASRVSSGRSAPVAPKATGNQLLRAFRDAIRQRQKELALQSEVLVDSFGLPA